MNLAKLGLALDENGALAPPDYIPPPEEPEEEEFDFEPSAPAYGASFSMMAATGGHRAKARRRSKPRRRPRTEPEEPKEKAPPFDLKPKPGETPEAFHKRVKKALGLLDLEQDILDMNLAELRSFFGYKKGTIRRGLFVRNVIWQIYRQVQASTPPTFVKNGGNVRSLWYHVKPLVRRHSKSFSGDDMANLFSAQLTIMTRLGLLSYRDLNLTDSDSAGRWVSPLYGTTNVILMAEKSAFSSKLIELGKRYGVTVQTTGGASSRVTVDTLLTEMSEAGHDLTRPFTIFVLVDIDPAGWNIAEEFIKQMKELGLKKVHAYHPYGEDRPLQPWIDIISATDLDTEFLAKYRFELKTQTRKTKLSDEWIKATGGLYGRNGKEHGLAADELIQFIDEHLARKIPEHLKQDPQVFSRLSALDDLVESTKRYLTARLLKDSL